MTDAPAPFTRPADLPVSVVLGLSGKGELDWARLRGTQYAASPKLAFYRLFSHAVLAVFVTQIYAGPVGFYGFAGWIIALCVVHVWAYRQDSSLADVHNHRITRDQLKHQALTAIVSGLVWGGAILVFPFFATDGELMAMLMIAALMVSGSVFFYAAAPVGTLCFSALVCLAAMIHLGIAGHWFAVTAVLVFLIAAIIGMIEVGRSHLAARIAEAALIEKDEVVSLLLREFEENEADWLWEIDPARRLRAVSPRFAFALGKTQADIEGKPLLEMIAGSKWEIGQFPASLHDLAERLKTRENFSNLVIQVSILGEDRWWELSGTPMRDEMGRFTGFRGVGSDVTAQRNSSEKIAYLARYDTLTKLPNRLHLTEALGEALIYSYQWKTRCALLMIDLDRFKSINDSLGHLVGDKLLAQVAARLQSLMGNNRLCGRLGGDEFAIVICDSGSPDGVRNFASQVIEQLSEPYQVDHHTLYVGASVGSAVGPRDGCSVEELMRNADLAMYRAKDMGGGNHCQFEPVLHASAEERRQLELALRKALGRDEMVLHYQPVVDARSQSIIGFEALVRWNSAEHGFVSPGKFIPLAEDTRLIVPIGKWVLRKACEEARNWPSHININVNVSPEQLLEPGFHADVVEALAATGLKPERLEVEVTESIFLRDASVARHALEEVMALGCSVALDDFGTGYSSLGYLRKLRFSTIKVDRTFVQGAATGSAESLAIINAVVAMAKSLDMTTTAEGVETADEAELIRNLGCDKIQGFYFGRPMTADDARALFKQQSVVLRA